MRGCGPRETDFKVMPSKFFFDVHRDGVVIVDGEGDELEDFRCAEETAIDFATATAREQFIAGKRAPVIIQVRDSEGARIFRITLTLAAERPGS
jgi:hypothetical protein